MIENELLSKIIETGDYISVVDKQITDKYFSGRNKKLFKFIREYYVSYGKTPSSKLVESKFPNFEFYECPEPINYYCDEVRNKLKQNTLVDGIESIVKKINEDAVEEAYDAVKKVINTIETEIVLSDRLEINKDVERRLDEYTQRESNKGMLGIPSYINRLDYLLKGYNKGEVITLLGYTGIGKSFFEIIQAVEQAKNGYKVLFFTTEMSTKLVMRRIDAVWNRFSYTRFRDGNLTAEEKKKFDRYVKLMKLEKEPLIIVEQVTGGISQISAKIDQHKPDMVYIDGGYLLEDEEKGEDDWKALVRIWRGVRKIALLKDVPVFISTQSRDRKVTLATISFAKAISNDSDVVLALEQDDQMFNDREIKIKPLKIREGELSGGIVMNWDFSKPDWSTIYQEDSNKFEEE